MTRRTFFAIGAAITAGAAGALAVAVKLRPVALMEHHRRFAGFGRTPLARLRAEYAWLAVEPGAFEKYLAGYERYYGAMTRFSVPLADFYTRFLLSTDFFPRLASPSADRAPVRFTGFYYPAESPCYNPVAQRPPSDAEIGAGDPGVKR